MRTTTRCSNAPRYEEDYLKIIQVRLPDYIHEKIKEFSREKGISMNNFIVSSVSKDALNTSAFLDTCKELEGSDDFDIVNHIQP